uniref:Uncharacterized protein n=1 Tax=Caenorhabditis japonica TaxID=281687 RepID=A0A8R1EJL8_CAEJA
MKFSRFAREWIPASRSCPSSGTDAFIDVNTNSGLPEDGGIRTKCCRNLQAIDGILNSLVLLWLIPNVFIRCSFRSLFLLSELPIPPQKSILSSQS